VQTDFDNWAENGCGPKEGKKKGNFQKTFFVKKTILEIAR
jgi:hypothetical protein